MNSGVIAATSKGHPISEMDPKEMDLRKGKFHLASKQMPMKGLFLILLTTAQTSSNEINMAELQKHPIRD